MSNDSTIPLDPLLLRLLDWKEAQDERERIEADTRRSEQRPIMQARMAKLLPQARKSVRAQALARGETLKKSDAEAQAALEAGMQAARELDNQAQLESEKRARRGELPLVDRNPWNQALSLLWQNLRTPLTDTRDPAVRLARDYRLPDEATADESSLQEYLCRVRHGAVDETSPLSAEVARLDSEGFGDRLAGMLRREFPEAAQEVLGGLPMLPQAEAARTAHPAGEGAPPANPCTHGLVLLAEFHRRNKKPTVSELASLLGVLRQDLYEKSDFLPLREMAKKLFGLFEKKEKRSSKGDWQGARGTKDEDGNIDAEDVDNEPIEDKTVD
jgi:hypothetical protein